MGLCEDEEFTLSRQKQPQRPLLHRLESFKISVFFLQFVGMVVAKCF